MPCRQNYSDRCCKNNPCFAQAVSGTAKVLSAPNKVLSALRYQLAIAKLPLAKDIADFQFDGTPINQTLVRPLRGRLHRPTTQCRADGGTGTGKTHLAIAIARSCIRSGARGPLLQCGRPRQPPRDRDRQRTVGAACRAFDRMDFIVLGELGYPQPIGAA